MVRRMARQHGHRLVAHIHEHSHAIAQVQLTRALWDVGRRIVQAEQRLQPLLARLGDDLTVTVRVESVDHHAIISSELADALEFLGANLSTASSFDSSAVRMSVPVSKLADALPLIADVTLRPVWRR